MYFCHLVSDGGKAALELLKDLSWADVLEFRGLRDAKTQRILTAACKAADRWDEEKAAEQWQLWDQIVEDAKIEWTQKFVPRMLILLQVFLEKLKNGYVFYDNINGAETSRQGSFTSTCSSGSYNNSSASGGPTNGDEQTSSPDAAACAGGSTGGGREDGAKVNVNPSPLNHDRNNLFPGGASFGKLGTWTRAGEGFLTVNGLTPSERFVYLAWFWKLPAHVFWSEAFCLFMQGGFPARKSSIFRDFVKCESEDDDLHDRDREDGSCGEDGDVGGYDEVNHNAKPLSSSRSRDGLLGSYGLLYDMHEQTTEDSTHLSTSSSTQSYADLDADLRHEEDVGDDKKFTVGLDLFHGVDAMMKRKLGLGLGELATSLKQVAVNKQCSAESTSDEGVPLDPDIVELESLFLQRQSQPHGGREFAVDERMCRILQQEGRKYIVENDYETIRQLVAEEKSLVWFDRVPPGLVFADRRAAFAEQERGGKSGGVGVSATASRTDKVEDDPGRITSEPKHIRQNRTWCPGVDFFDSASAGGGGTGSRRCWSPLELRCFPAPPLRSLRRNLKMLYERAMWSRKLGDGGGCDHYSVPDSNSLAHVEFHLFRSMVLARVKSLHAEHGFMGARWELQAEMLVLSRMLEHLIAFYARKWPIPREAFSTIDLSGVGREDQDQTEGDISAAERTWTEKNKRPRGPRRTAKCLRKEYYRRLTATLDGTSCRSDVIPDARIKRNSQERGPAAARSKVEAKKKQNEPIHSALKTPPTNLLNARQDKDLAHRSVFGPPQQGRNFAREIFPRCVERVRSLTKSVFPSGRELEELSDAEKKNNFFNPAPCEFVQHLSALLDSSAETLQAKVRAAMAMENLGDENKKVQQVSCWLTKHKLVEDMRACEKTSITYLPQWIKLKCDKGIVAMGDRDWPVAAMKNTEEAVAEIRNENVHAGGCATETVAAAGTSRAPVGDAACDPSHKKTVRFQLEGGAEVVFPNKTAAQAKPEKGADVPVTTAGAPALGSVDIAKPPSPPGLFRAAVQHLFSKFAGGVSGASLPGAGIGATGSSSASSRIKKNHDELQPLSTSLSSLSTMPSMELTRENSHETGLSLSPVRDQVQVAAPHDIEQAALLLSEPRGPADSPPVAKRAPCHPPAAVKKKAVAAGAAGGAVSLSQLAMKGNFSKKVSSANIKTGAPLGAASASSKTAEATQGNSHSHPVKKSVAAEIFKMTSSCSSANSSTAGTSAENFWDASAPSACRRRALEFCRAHLPGNKRSFQNYPSKRQQLEERVEKCKAYWSDLEQRLVGELSIIGTAGCSAASPPGADDVGSDPKPVEQRVVEPNQPSERRPVKTPPTPENKRPAASSSTPSAYATSITIPPKSPILPEDAALFRDVRRALTAFLVAPMHKKMEVVTTEINEPSVLPSERPTSDNKNKVLGSETFFIPARELSVLTQEDHELFLAPDVTESISDVSRAATSCTGGGSRAGLNFNVARTSTVCGPHQLPATTTSRRNQLPRDPTKSRATVEVKVNFLENGAFEAWRVIREVSSEVISHVGEGDGEGSCASSSGIPNTSNKIRKGAMNKKQRAGNLQKSRHQTSEEQQTSPAGGNSTSAPEYREGVIFCREEELPGTTTLPKKKMKIFKGQEVRITKREQFCPDKKIYDILHARMTANLRDGRVEPHVLGSET
eukprot:g7591.t1